MSPQARELTVVAPRRPVVLRQPGLRAEALPLVAEFGDLLRRYRLRLGVSQNELSKRAACNASYINRLESGDRGLPSREAVGAFARALALGPDDVDRLYGAAGYLPPGLQKVGPGDSTLAAVLRLLTDDTLAPESRADFRAVVETIAARWQQGGREAGRQGARA